MSDEHIPSSSPCGRESFARLEGRYTGAISSLYASVYELLMLLCWKKLRLELVWHANDICACHISWQFRWSCANHMLRRKFIEQRGTVTLNCQGFIGQLPPIMLCFASHKSLLDLSESRTAQPQVSRERYLQHTPRRIARELHASIQLPSSP